MEAVDLRGVINDALFMVSNKLDRGGVAVTKQFPEDLPLVRGNASQLEQVFMNLFSNACDAMQGRTPSLLSINLVPVFGGNRADGGGVEVRVTDNGSGMPATVRDQMFLPFFTTKPKGEGTGLGLTISRNIIRRHGGEIRGESEEGKGTVFHVTLPPWTPQAGPE